MRITNNMMVNNMLLGLNRNTQRLNDIYMQMSTLKKIQKPSDDPIIAGRALKFRTNVAELGQYQDNVKQARSWMEVTEQSLINIRSVLDSMRERCVQASSDTLSTEERKKVIEDLKQLKNQLVLEGNVSYAGRYSFTGFKTDTKLIYDKADSTRTFEFEQEFTKEDLETLKIGESEFTRIRLPYGNIDGGATTVEIDGAPITIVEKNSYDTRTSISVEDGPYDTPPSGQVYVISDTGEIIFNPNDISPTTDIKITYQKTNFNIGDPRPENYFDCKDITDTANPIEYSPSNDAMEYEVGTNTKITVNTLGNKVLTPDLMQDIDELIRYVENYDQRMEEIEEGKRPKTDEFSLGSLFDNMIGKLDKHMSNLSTHHADLGSRMKRLEFIENRISSDKVNFTELMSSNEDVDIEEVYTQFSIQQAVYQSSLIATSRIIQPTLVDFIK
ncbi:flagellar hook-associated protein FlgL [Defluviitalea saccharophila]|uniref:Flagellar hook-associated protein FlgL n=1 Tax=Defluviitalea saccharophila TaxID=879970 RepID=A0ABZ2Y2E1_9FIRM